MIESTEKVAKLARIAIEDGEVPAFSRDLEGIIRWVEQLREVDVAGLEGTIHPTGQTLLMRKDDVTFSNTVDDLMRNAPETQYNMFSVPKVVE